MPEIIAALVPFVLLAQAAEAGGTLGFITAILNLGGLAAFGVVMFVLYTRALREHKEQVTQITDAHKVTIEAILKDHKEQIAVERSSGERRAADARAACIEEHRESMARFDQLERKLEAFRRPRPS